MRGVMVMALANKRNALALTTEQERLAVGYCATCGDMAGALAPLGDVYKPASTSLRHINSLHKWIPESSITKAPSADSSQPDRPGRLGS